MVVAVAARALRSVSTGRGAGRPPLRSPFPKGKRVARIQVPSELARAQAQPARRSGCAPAIEEIRQEFEHWLGLGYAATAMEIKAGGGTYLLEPWAERSFCGLQVDLAPERLRFRGHMLRCKVLQEIQMPLVTPFETSFGRTTLRRILLVEADVDGVVGWGECVAGEGPFYAPETVETAWSILRDFVWPALRGREFTAAADVWGLLDPIRGNNMAKGALESAIWDAEARQKGVPLWKLIGGEQTEIPCGVSIGIKENDDELERVVEQELAAGYQRIKIKIKPGQDIEPVARIRRRFPRIPPNGGRQQRLSFGRRHVAEPARGLFPNDDRAAARLGRHLESCGVAEENLDAHLPRRMHTQ